MLLFLIIMAITVLPVFFFKENLNKEFTTIPAKFKRNFIKDALSLYPLIIVLILILPIFLLDGAMQDLILKGEIFIGVLTVLLILKIKRNL